MSFFSSLLPVNSPSLRTFNLPPMIVQTGNAWVFASLPLYRAYIKQAVISNKSSTEIQYSFYYKGASTPLDGNSDLTLPGWYDYLRITSEDTLDVIIHLELVKEEIARGTAQL